MKTATLFALALCAPLSCFAADSAYKALRVVGTERGQDVLNHVIEVQGRGGTPQPTLWKVVLDDAAARGGVRELEVTKGKIASEHTPVRTYSGSSADAVMDFHKLNLDSEGAFTVIEKEASKAHLSFDSVDYTLRSGDNANSAPVWVVQLLDTDHHAVGTMKIAADTGAIVKSDLYGRRAPDSTAPLERPKPREIVEEQRTVVVEDRPLRDEPDRVVDDSTADEGDDVPHKGVGHKIKQVFKDAGASLEGFFTGKRPSGPARDDD
jgi:hypothetical protein